MQLSVLTSSITEPVTHDEVKTYMGHPASDTTQDALIDSMITAAREWLEQRTGVSVVSKSYKAYYEKYEDDDGWYDLPRSPVLASPVITVSVCGVSTTFQQEGLIRVRVSPDNTYGTIHIGSSTDVFYVEIIFQAGATNNIANLCLQNIVSTMFNFRDSAGVNVARIPFDTLQMIDSLGVNL